MIFMLLEVAMASLSERVALTTSVSRGSIVSAPTVKIRKQPAHRRLARSVFFIGFHPRCDEISGIAAEEDR